MSGDGAWATPTFRLRMLRSGLLAIVLAAAFFSGAATHADEAIVPLPPVEESFFDRIRLAALGDPQDLTEPLLPDDVAPPGQPRQEFEPPAGRKLPPGAKPGPLQQAIFTVTELPRLGSNGLGLTTLDTSLTIGLPAPTVNSPLL
ncbi:MAG: hypothetical protein RLZZ440_1543, partial [Planctomycetota bacterium]